tara:strand:+ start:348 stop:623 length:276 start_codon:yes stop_codon:yes gene_type:complete
MSKNSPRLLTFTDPEAQATYYYICMDQSDIKAALQELIDNTDDRMEIITDNHTTDGYHSLPETYWDIMTPGYTSRFSDAWNAATQSDAKKQ